MGQSLIGRPIGPSYVPGTSQGRSSANAPISQMTAPQPATSPNPLLPGPAQQAPNTELPNPAQGPRGKIWDANRQLQATGKIGVSGQYQPSSAIGTGLRRYQIGGREV